jgi:nucleotide-binding universal stress UspA family protein
MFHQVIVGVDGFDGGRDATALARALGARRIVLVDAYPIDLTAQRRPVRAFEEALNDDAMRRVEAARVEAGVEAELRVIADPSPARALQQEAEARGADLLVVGSCHRTAVGRVLLGDVSRGVLHGAPCPVAVAPHRFRASGARIARVAVGFDGSSEAREALRLAAQARDALGAQLLVVGVIGSTAVNEPSPILVDWSAIQDAQREDAENGLREAVAEVGGAAETRTLTGNPARVLSELSTEVDLVVVGSRGWGALKRVELGSTSDRLAHHASCPVIVVPRPAVEAAAREGDKMEAVAGPGS